MQEVERREPLSYLVTTFTDRAKSGKDMNRPELRRLLRKIADDEIDLVMVTELSRISRSMKDFSEIWELMKRHKCAFKSLRENFDTTTAAGEMMIYSMANMAQFERRQVAERVTANMNARAKRGLFNGGSIPYGLKKVPDKTGYLEVHEEQAKIVKAAFHAFLREESLSLAAKWLNDNGFRMEKEKWGGGSLMRLGFFTVDNLYRMLTNVVYIGKKKYKEDGKTKFAKAVWPAIIDELSFERVNKKLKENKSRKKPASPRRYPYILSGLTYCEKCGDVMCGKSAHGNSGKVGYYEHGWATKRDSCLSKKIFQCDPHRVPAKKLEPLVWSKVKEFILEDKMAKRLFDKAQKIYHSQTTDGELTELQAKIYDINSQLGALAERLSELPVAVSAQPIYDQMAELESKKGFCKDRILALNILGPTDGRKPAALSDFKAFRKSLAKAIRNPKSTDRAKVISKLIHKVEVGVDQVTVHYFVGKDRINKESADLAGSRGPSQKNLSIGSNSLGSSLLMVGDSASIGK